MRPRGKIVRNIAVLVGLLTVVGLIVLPTGDRTDAVMVACICMIWALIVARRSHGSPPGRE